MYDISELREKNNCIEVISREIGEPAKGRGYYASWKCPFCGEHSNYSFTAWADCWKCWKGCSSGGDAIKFIQLYRNMTFSEACEYLGGVATKTPLPPQTKIIRPDEPPNADWVEDATAILNRSQEVLFSQQGKQGLDYLHKRGFTDDTIRQMGFGYIPSEAAFTRWRGIILFQGIVIPSFREGQLWNARVRTFAKDPQYRYLNLEGGKLRGSLFGGDNLPNWQPVVLVEGDFNAAILNQLGFNAVSTSAATNYLTTYWLRKLLTAPVVLVWGDADKAGQAFTSKHQAMGRAFLPFEDPDETLDANDMYLNSPDYLKDMISRWIEAYHDKGIREPLFALMYARDGGELENA